MPSLRASAGVLLSVLVATRALGAQTRTLVQDSTVNNLVAAPGAPVTPPGRLGAVERVGTGRTHVVLIPGAGFGGAVYRPFADSMAAAFDVTVHLITLPGFGGTAPWALPATPYRDATWMRASEAAIVRYLDSLRIATASVIGHWIVGSQIALRLGLDHPQRVDRVVLLAGVAESYYKVGPDTRPWTLEQRASFADAMGTRWFRTVTYATWHDNNFMPYDYAVQPLRGMLLWRRASEPAVSTWVRYLLEFYATDVTIELPRLRVPVVRVEPALDDPGVFVDGQNTYLRDLLHESWSIADSLAPSIRRVVVSGARTFVMYDQPAEVMRILAGAGLPARR
jgi:pimeloyl-ACP methyl ester carboxylesterase